MQRFTAACAQFAVTPMDVAANAAKAVTGTRRAGEESGGQLVVLPETVRTALSQTSDRMDYWTSVGNFC